MYPIIVEKWTFVAKFKHWGDIIDTKDQNLESMPLAKEGVSLNLVSTKIKRKVREQISSPCAPADFLGVIE